MTNGDLKSRVTQALFEVAELFGEPVSEPSPEPPAGVTLAEAWAMYKETWYKWRNLADKKRDGRPKVEHAVRTVLINPLYYDFSHSLVADIVKRVYAQYGYKCNCSARSVGWYISQFGRAWDIPVRREKALDLDADEGW